MQPDKTNLIELPSLLALIVITFTVIGLQSSSASPKHYAHSRYISPGITCISCALIETQLLSDHAPSHSTPHCLTSREQQTLCLFLDSYFQFLFFFSFFNCSWYRVECVVFFYYLLIPISSFYHRPALPISTHRLDEYELETHLHLRLCFSVVETHPWPLWEAFQVYFIQYLHVVRH